MGRLLSLILVVLGIILTAWFFAPGMMSNDSINQYEQAVSGMYNDMHPPIVALIWRYLLIFSNNQSPMFFLQLVCFWVGLFLIAASQERVWKQLLVILSGFLPQVFVQFGMIWKDVVLVGFYILGIGLIIFRESNLTKHRAFRSVALFFAIVLLWVGTATRYNAIFTVTPLIFCYFCFRVPIFSALLRTLAAILIYLTSYIFVVDYILQASHVHPGGQIFVYDTVGVAAVTGDESLIPKFISDEIKVEKRSLMASYTPKGGASVLFWGGKMLIPTRDSWNEEAKNSWMQMIKKYPVQYLNHRYGVFRSVIGFDDDEVYYPWHEVVDGNPYGLHASDRDITTEVFCFLNTLKKGLLFRVWLYLGIGILLLILLFARRAHHFSQNLKLRSFLILALTLSALFHTAAYFFIAPVSDLRFNYWSIDAILLATMLFIADSIKPRATK